MGFNLKKFLFGEEDKIEQVPLTAEQQMLNQQINAEVANDPGYRQRIKDLYDISPGEQGQIREQTLGAFGSRAQESTRTLRSLLARTKGGTTSGSAMSRIAGQQSLLAEQAGDLAGELNLSLARERRTLRQHGLSEDMRVGERNVAMLSGSAVPRDRVVPGKKGHLGDILQVGGMIAGFATGNPALIAGSASMGKVSPKSTNRGTVDMGSGNTGYNAATMRYF